MKLNSCNLASYVVPFLHVFILALFAILFSGCESMRTEGANFLLDVQVAGLNAEGRTWRATSQEIKTLPLDPKAVSPFPLVEYRGDLLEWKFGVGAEGFGGVIRNLTAEPLCLRFDQARITSNTQAQPIALRVSQVIHYSNIAPPDPKTGKWVMLQNKKGDERFFDSPKLCFAPQQPEYFFFSQDLSSLFPSGRMFNVSWLGDNLTEKGIGNWIKINVLIEHDNQRQGLEVKLTVSDSKWSVSYH